MTNESQIRAIYRVRCAAGEAEVRAEAIALEQSAEMPREAIRANGREDLIESAVARVERIAPIDDDAFDVEIEIPSLTQDGGVGQLVNALFGNSSMHDDVALIDAILPREIASRLGGPRLGARGLREATGIPERPLTCTALKPQGLTAEELASLCESFATAGVDVIKDDHGLADQPRAPFDERVARCAAAAHRAAQSTGRLSLYVPNLLGTPSQIARQLETVRREELAAVMVAPALIGLPSFHEIARDNGDLIFLAHPAFSGSCRVAPRVLLATLYPLIGADAVIYPHAGGRFGAYDDEVCRELADRLRTPAHGGAPAMPVPAGGMDAERARELVRFYGSEVTLLVGGSLYLGGSRLRERAGEFVSAVAEAHGEWGGTS